MSATPATARSSSAPLAEPDGLSTRSIIRFKGMPSCTARDTTTGDVTDSPNLIMKLKASDVSAVPASRAYGSAEKSSR